MVVGGILFEDASIYPGCCISPNPTGPLCRRALEGLNCVDAPCPSQPSLLPSFTAALRSRLQRLSLLLQEPCRVLLDILRYYVILTTNRLDEGAARGCSPQSALLEQGPGDRTPETLRVHSPRHAFATHHVAQGTAQELLGHVDLLSPSSGRARVEIHSILGCNVLIYWQVGL